MEMSTLGALITIGVMLVILLLVNLDLMRIDRNRAQERKEEIHAVSPFLGGLRPDPEE